MKNEKIGQFGHMSENVD